MSNYDIIMIGHITRDTLEHRGKVTPFIGGAAYFSSFAARRSNAKICVVTKLARSDFTILDAMKKEGIDFILALQNTGRVHYRTKGSITVETSSGDKVFEVELPDVPVLPGSEREVKVRYDKPISQGTYKALAIVDIGKKDLIGSETTFSVE